MFAWMKKFKPLRSKYDAGLLAETVRLPTNCLCVTNGRLCRLHEVIKIGLHYGMDLEESRLRIKVSDQFRHKPLEPINEMSNLTKLDSQEFYKALEENK